MQMEYFTTMFKVKVLHTLDTIGEIEKHKSADIVSHLCTVCISNVCEPVSLIFTCTVIIAVHCKGLKSFQCSVPHRSISYYNFSLYDLYTQNCLLSTYCGLY